MTCPHLLDGAGQLGHGLVEGDVLEELDEPGKDSERGRVLEGLGPVGQEGEVGELLRLGQQRLEQQRHVEGRVDVEGQRGGGDQQHKLVQPVPEGHEVLEPHGAHLQHLLHHVVEEEQAEDELGPQHRVLPGRDVAEELHGAEVTVGEYSASRDKFEVHSGARENDRL